MTTCPSFTQKDIDLIFEKYNELDTIAYALSEQARTIQDRYNDDKVNVTREVKGKNKELELTQRDLWVELYHLGFESEAKKDLEKLHPEFFAIKEKETAIVNEILELEVKTFGFKHKEMSLPNIIRLFQGLIKLESYGKSDSA